MKTDVSSSNSKRKKKKTIKEKKTHRTNSDVDRVIFTLRKLKDENKTDIEIRQTLGLELRWYQKLMKRIHEEDEAIWFSITRTELQGQLLKLYSSINHTYGVAKAISDNEEKSCKDRLDALEIKDNSRLNLVKLLTESPDMITKVNQTVPVESRSYLELGSWQERGKRLFDKDDKI